MPSQPPDSGPRSDRDNDYRDPSDPNDPLRCGAFSLGEEFEVANCAVPAKPPTSGDFHAAIPLEDGSIAVVMGDVVGHGEEAAAHAGVLCRAIGGCLIEGLPPEEALGFVNAAAEMSPEFEGFATAFAARVEPGTGAFTYASGGHEPGLVATPESSIEVELSRIVQTLETTGPPLGVMGAEEVRYEQRSGVLPGGGTLLLYTDGITEARRGHEIMGLERLSKAFAHWRRLRPLALVCKIIGLARAFTGQGRRLRDDAALLALRRRRWPHPKA